MDEAFKSTIDPTCLQDPPLTMDLIKQLDVFRFCLYFMLTLMPCVSLLLYLEQCAFIYKKLPYPKKTTIIWISGGAPVLGTMACFGIWVPRATMITDMMSNCYYAVVVYKFLVLLIEELGGASDFLQRFSSKTFRIDTGPCCCCCPCIPRVQVTRQMLFLLKLGSLQNAILRTVISVLSLILSTNGIFNPADLKVTGATLWIQLFMGVLTIISLWPIGIVFMNIKSLLHSQKIIPKYAMYQLIFVLSQLQTSIINILAFNGIIACAPPFSSRARGSMLSQQLLIMEMFIISLVTRSLYRRMYDPLPSEEQDNEQNEKEALQTALVEHDV
ncbi:organic solute transporter subunit alpha-like [Girardinichthys multiradiatus]|uniref:organic solute transporter subunit alpha-like n=1 Tax=Girardinichthys multiradiatus TaxID=208333 RepID=UPI001FAE1FB5|nr:organic solute transporter subunit alpha-like [Girardinichthys multiradiatus]